MIESRSFAPSSLVAKAARMLARLSQTTRAQAGAARSLVTGPQNARPGAWGLLAGDLRDRSR